MSYCSGIFSPTECIKRSLFLIFTISFTIHLISYFYTSPHLAVRPKSHDLHMESEKSLLRKISTNFKQISETENGELPPQNEKSGNKATTENEKSGNKATTENEKSGNKATPENEKSGNKATTENEKSGNKGTPENEKSGNKATTENEKSGNKGTPENEKSGNKGTTENEKSGNKGTTENEKSGNKGTTENEKSGNKGTPEDEKSGNKGTPENEKSGNKGTPENEKSGNKGTPENEKSGNKGTPENEKSGNKATTENEKSGNKGTPENEKSGNKATTENEKSGNKATSENEKSGNKGTPENEKSGNKGTPENEKSGNKGTPTPTQPFAFIINEEEKCKDRTPFLVLLISTTAAELEHRDAIRKSWGSEAAVPGADIVRLFMLGSDPKGDNGDVLLRESEQHRDIIQQDFLDTYNNLTLKTLMGMSWVASYCSGTRFAMKTDSDVFVNTMHLIEKLLRPLPPPTQNYFTGHLMTGGGPIRNKASKWYISEEEFPENRYHPFCSGTGYVFSGDLAAKIVDASLMIKFIHLEDVYVGFCLNAKGVEITRPPNSLFNIHKVPFSPCVYNELITSHHIKPYEHIRYWKALQEKKHTCQKRKVRPGAS